MAYPTNYRYTKEHEWLDVSGTAGTIGITDYAQSTLGDIVFVQLPDEGTAVQAGDSLGEIESTKSVSELYAPITGTVVSRNATLADEPELMDGAGDVMTSAGIPFRGGYRRKRPANLREGEVFSACGAATLIDRDLFLSLGGFDERYTCHNHCAKGRPE